MNTAARLRAWFAGHQRQVLIVAGVGVGGFALYKARQSGGFGASSSTGGGTATAGLNSLPAADTTTTAAINPNGQIVTELSALTRLLNRRLPPIGSGRKTGPKPPPPLPKPGHGKYTIRAGDTLAKISQALYGEVTKQTIARLRRFNPTLATFGNNDPLRHYAGHAIVIPRATPPHKKPKPQPIKPAKR